MSTAPNGASTLPPAARSNALQNRITAVLSASYADLEIRDALAELDARGATNTTALRRDLRLDAQAELIACHGEIVQDFGAVAAQLQRIGQAVTALDASCVALRKHIQAANRETGPMLDEARDILRDRQQVATKQQLLRAFSAHFVISDAELTALTSTSAPVDESFFRALARVRKIHTDSQILLGGENQRLGLEILEQSSRQLDAGFQKLYRFVQREVAALVDLENPQLGAAIRRALRVLAERPRLFQGLLDFLAEAREHSLAASFYAALTGTPTDQHHPVLGKAIELSAHDPLRYVSDMLAWAHSAAVSEREALEILFIADGEEIAANIRLGLEIEPWNAADDSADAAGRPKAFDGRAALSELLDRVLAGVFQQLKQRTEQVLHHHAHSDGKSLAVNGSGHANATSDAGALLAYKISRLIHFYASNLFTPHLLRAGSVLLTQTLSPLVEAAYTAFRSATRERIVSLRADPAALLLPSAAGATHANVTRSAREHSLGAPDFLLEALEVLQALRETFESSLSASASSATQRSREFASVLEEALTPYLSLCALAARKSLAASSGSKKDKADAQVHAAVARWIFLGNCLFAVKSAVASWDWDVESQVRLPDGEDGFHFLLADESYSSDNQGGKDDDGEGEPALRLARRSAAADRSDDNAGEQGSLAAFSSFPSAMQEVQSQLTMLTHAYFAVSSGLAMLLNDTKTLHDLSSHYTAPEPLLAAAQKLDAFLPTAADDARGIFLGEVQDRVVVRAVVETAGERFVADCESFVEMLSQADQAKAKGLDNEAEEDEKVWLREVFPRTGDEIRVLLS